MAASDELYEPEIGDHVQLGNRRLSIFARASGGWVVGERLRVINQTAEVFVAQHDVDRWRWNEALERWEMADDRAGTILCRLKYDDLVRGPLIDLKPETRT